MESDPAIPDHNAAHWPTGSIDDARPRLVMLGPDDMELASLADHAGFRLLGHSAWAEAADRLDHLVDAELIWLRVAAPVAAPLLDQLVTTARQIGCSVVVDVIEGQLDCVFAALAHLPRIEFLMNANRAERLAAMGVVKGRRRNDAAFNDSADNVALRQIAELQADMARLSNLIERIAPNPAPNSATTLAKAAWPASRGDAAGAAGHGTGWGVGGLAAPRRSFTAPTAAPTGTSTPPDAHAPAPPPVTSDAVRRLLRARRLRERFFDAELFADPAWDMLLDLYAARLEGKAVSVSSLCIAAAVPATTALRWIRTMTNGGWFVREADPRDGRRIFIGLSDSAAAAMDGYFAARSADTL